MKLLILVICQLVLCTPALAEGYRNKVEELLIAMQFPESVESTRNRMKDIFNQQARSIKFTEDNEDLLEKYMNGMAETISNEFAWEKVSEGYIDSYASTFSEPEINQLLVFYKSDVGKMYAAKSIAITEKQMKLGERISLSIQPKILNLQNEMVREAQKRAAIKLLNERK